MLYLIIFNKLYLIITTTILYLFFKYIIWFFLIIIFNSLCKAYKIYYFQTKTTVFVRKIEYTSHMDLTWFGVLDLFSDVCFYSFLQNKIKTNLFLIRPKLNFIFFLERLIFYFLGVNRLMWWLFKKIFFSLEFIELKEIAFSALLGPSSSKILFVEGGWRVNGDKKIMWLQFIDALAPNMSKHEKLSIFDYTNPRLNTLSKFSYSVDVSYVCTNKAPSSKMHSAVKNVIDDPKFVFLITDKSKAFANNNYGYELCTELQSCKRAVGLKVPVSDILREVNPKQVNNLFLTANLWGINNDGKSNLYTEQLNSALKGFEAMVQNYYIQMGNPNIPIEVFRKGILYQLFLYNNQAYCFELFNKKIDLTFQHNNVLIDILNKYSQ